jgi:hypothetical protein
MGLYGQLQGYLYFTYYTFCLTDGLSGFFHTDPYTEYFSGNLPRSQGCRWENDIKSSIRGYEDMN